MKSMSADFVNLSAMRLLVGCRRMLVLQPPVQGDHHDLRAGSARPGSLASIASVSMSWTDHGCSEGSGRPLVP